MKTHLEKMTDAEFVQGMIDADRIVASWPEWKRGILEASGSPTAKRREVKEKAMSGIDPCVLEKCYKAFDDHAGMNAVEAAIEKYRELTGVGPITAEMVLAMAKTLYQEKSLIIASLRKDAPHIADKLNELASRPAPAVVVPEEIRETAEMIVGSGKKSGYMPKFVALAKFALSLLPQPPKPEPGQRAYEAYFKAVEGLDIDDNCVPWGKLLPVDHQCWAAVETALKGDADGSAK